MLTLIKLINIYLPIKYKRFFLFTFFLLLFCGFAEIISLGSLIPFLSFLEGNDLFSSNYKFIYNLFPEEIYNNYQFYIAAFIFGLSSIFSSFLRLTSLWANSLLASKVGSYWSDLMFSGTLSKDYEYHINQNSSKLIVSLTQHLNSTVRAIFFLFQFITGILITIFIISFLLFIDPKISSIAFLIFGTYYALIATFFKKKAKE